MRYKEQFSSRFVFNVRETKRKQRLFNKKLGKAWHNKKEYTTHFFSKHFSKKQNGQTVSNKSDSTLSVAKANLQLGIKRDEELGKLAVYTCIFGGYDNLQDPLIKSKYCDYFVVTDKEVSEKSVWKKLTPKYYPEGFDSWHPAIKNRYYKMHPDELFPDYKYSLYIDGNIRPITDIYPFLIQMNKQNAFIGLFDHPCAYCVYKSAQSLVELDLINKEGAEKQVSRYEQEGFPHHYGMFECGFILRKHNEKKCKEVMQIWWNEYLKGEKRDQMCFTYALWQNGLHFSDVCCFGNNVRHSSRLKLREHNRPHCKVTK